MSLSFDVSDKLFPNLLTLIVQLCSTGILFFFIKKYLWKPARKYLNDKAELTQSKLSEANQLRSAAEKDSKEAQKQLRQASNQAKDIIEKGKSEGNIIKNSLIKDARNQADHMLKTARNEIELEKKKSQQDINNEIVDVALLAASQFISTKTDSEENRKAVEAMVKDLSDERGK